MDVFYNPDGVGDVLIIPLENADRYEVKHEIFGDIIKITKEDGTVVGYNIFRASTNIELPGKGKAALTEELLNQIKGVFNKQGVQDSLDFDLSPKFVVGYVNTREAHEDADNLSVCQVDTGDDSLQIVCGAPNIDAGQKVVVAKVGATMPSGMRIKPTELRGVPSNGMICSQKELGLPDAPKEKGIYVLDDSYRTGDPFEF